ncbi:unnamed protein product [Ambrosiozyma monospora]|uniref:Unnamed protein product n=1 Tax=Ambrosiozyma monospora TaxID=43982 RepID=A0ACB5TV39_AMBMO|nr:unnamed protein product [Ambrosiozyma monospora]
MSSTDQLLNPLPEDAKKKSEKEEKSRDEPDPDKSLIPIKPKQLSKGTTSSSRTTTATVTSLNQTTTPINKRSRKGTKHSAKFQRNVTGCLNCRKKKKKCDGLKPTCSRCLKAGQDCLQPPIKFMRCDIDATRNCKQIYTEIKFSNDEDGCSKSISGGVTHCCGSKENMLCCVSGSVDHGKSTRTTSSTGSVITATTNVAVDSISDSSSGDSDMSIKSPLPPPSSSSQPSFPTARKDRTNSISSNTSSISESASCFSDSTSPRSSVSSILATSSTTSATNNKNNYPATFARLPPASNILSDEVHFKTNLAYNRINDLLSDSSCQRSIP